MKRLIVLALLLVASCRRPDCGSQENPCEQADPNAWVSTRTPDRIATVAAEVREISRALTAVPSPTYDAELRAIREAVSTPTLTSKQWCATWCNEEGIERGDYNQCQCWDMRSPATPTPTPVTCPEFFYRRGVQCCPSHEVCQHWKSGWNCDPQCFPMDSRRYRIYSAPTLTPTRTEE